MRRLLIYSILLLALPGAAFAQREKYDRSHSAEFRILGLPPLTTVMEENMEKKLADKGQKYHSPRYYTFALSYAVKMDSKVEVVLTAGYAGYRGKVVQYGVFGTDPNGLPRYNLKNIVNTKHKNIYDSWSASLTVRYTWTEYKHEEWYSALGAGYNSDVDSHYWPTVTLLGVKFKIHKHLYLYAENTYSPTATFFCGGIGWRF